VTNHARVLAALEEHVSVLHRKVRGTTLARIATELADEGVRGRTETELLVSLVLRLRQLAEDKVAELVATERRWRDFADRVFKLGADERRQLIIDHVTATTEEGAERRADLAALERYLDYDALRERHAIARHRILVILEIAVTFIGNACARAIERAESRARQALELLEGGRVAELLGAVVDAQTRWQLRAFALDGLVRIAELARTRDVAWHGRLSNEHLNLAVRYATSHDEHPWVQGRAMRLVLALSFDLGVDLIAKRLGDLQPAGKDFLVRRQLVDLLGADTSPRTIELLLQCKRAGDPSPHVRQGIAEALGRRGEIAELHALAGLDAWAHEASAQVRASAIQAACAAATTPELAKAATGLVLGVISAESEALPLSVACEDITTVIARVPPEPAMIDVLLSELLRLAHREDRTPAVREMASAAAERVAQWQSRELQAWKQFLARFVETIPPGRARTLDIAGAPELPDLPPDPAFLGRILASLSRTGYPLYATRNGNRLHLWRGDRYRRRLWRILHELRRPAPNKRQGFSHTRGRVMRGRFRAPPGGLDEFTATVTPGERVFIAEEGTWGRHLPTVDDVLDLPMWSGDEVRVFSSFGVTSITPPRSLLRRMRNRIAIARAYEKIAALRVKSLQSDEPHARVRYSDALQEYGVTLTFEPYTYPNQREAQLPERLTSLFPAPPSRDTQVIPKAIAAAGAFPGLGEMGDWLHRQTPYFTSLQGNGQLALALFVVGFAVLFFVGAYRKRARIARARAAIPLSIGGWGTRGKSGTERLKAAVFHGLGYEVAVKTTGCEAMLIHSVPDESPHEIFIFRSFDKATIWEQRDTLETAAALGAEVFLWECMALQPEFVELLQRDWMRDDFVTLTNAFPDHEDIQGPSGADVADCISSFIPRDSTLLTSEVNFLPVFAERCRERNTAMIATSPRSADLIAEDVLDLFPYREHPRNIALVADLSEQLGIERQLAIATMAEHVVPDLGVLKAYPPACVRGRTLTFSNGMSANERTGFLNNWHRMELGAKDVEDPRQAVVTVVNNRWDRVSRSEVFARIMVEDAIVDAHVLIGSNLRGLQRYVADALRRHVDTLEIVVDGDLDDPNGLARARQRLATQLARLRVPSPSPRAIHARIETYAASAGLTLDPAGAGALDVVLAKLCTPTADDTIALSDVRREVADQLGHLDSLLVERAGAARPGPEVLAPATREDVIAHALRQATRIALHARLAARLASAFADRDIETPNRELRDAYRALFTESVIVVENAGETGDRIIDRCASCVPPGTQVNVMGIQNIKGTGLDFVYRWLALDQTMARLARLGSDTAVYRELEAFEDYGLVDSGIAADALATHAEQVHGEAQVLAKRALERVRAIHTDKQHKLDEAGEASLLARIVAPIEAILDPIDSMRRRRRADRIVGDLIRHRISHARAAKEMRALYDRQGGGWLLG
jgi:poly-gamma-glutamate synthase PgsB/CapB